MFVWPHGHTGISVITVDFFVMLMSMRTLNSVVDDLSTLTHFIYISPHVVNIRQKQIN